MIKKIAFVLAIIVIVVLGVRGLLFLYLSEPTILQTASSPDGQFIAYVYEANAGATTDYMYHLTILKRNAPLGKRWGNVYRSGHAFSVEWTRDDELYVHNTSTIEIYKQKRNTDGINVVYKFYER